MNWNRVEFPSEIRNAYLWFGKPKVKIDRANIPPNARSFLTFGAYDYDIDFDGIEPLTHVQKGDVIVLTFNDNNFWVYLNGKWTHNPCWWSAK